MPPPRTAAPIDRRRSLIVTAAIVVVVALLLRGCFTHHQNDNERLAQTLTTALQRNDTAAVRKLQNAETATHVNNGVVGRASDTLAPLGKIDSVVENTPTADPPRAHEFTVTFEKGVVHERMRLDPDGKIVLFSYDLVPKP